MQIIVNSEEDKQKLIEESKYIHDFLEVVKYKSKKGKKKSKWIGLDSEKAGALMHIYMCPEIIIVKK